MSDRYLHLSTQNRGLNLCPDEFGTVLCVCVDLFNIPHARRNSTQHANQLDYSELTIIFLKKRRNKEDKMFKIR